MNKSKHYITTIAVVVLVWAFTASSRAQKYSDWSEPINLGPTVNSAVGEITPDISSDRETLFFASTRPGSLGLADLYMTTRTKLSEK